MKLHTFAEVGDLIGVSARTVERLVAAGGLRAVDISTTKGGRRQMRVRDDDYREWVDKRTAKSA